MKRHHEECYDLIENMTTHHNDWDTSAQRSESSSSITSSSDTEITALKAKMAEINKNLMRPPLATLKTYMLQEPIKGANQGQNQPLAYQAPAYKASVYQAPIHQPQIPQPQVVTTNQFTNFMKANDDILKNMQTNMTSLTNSNLELKNMFVVECETESTKYTVHPTNNGSTEDVQPPVVLTESLILNSEPVISPIIEPKKGDAVKFLIPCDFLRMAECLALANLGASINLMPLSMWNSLSLYDLSPTCMTLELTDRLISHQVGVAEDVFVKVGTFHFPANFVVVDFDADPRVPLILERYFLKTGRALIDVFEGKRTLHIGKEAITFNLDQSSRYSANYNDMTTNRIGVIDMACEEYSQEVLSFSDVIASGNPTPYYDPIVYTTSPTLTPFGNSDFLLIEVDAYLALEDDSTSPEVDQSYVDSEGDILLLEAFLNDDPSLPAPNQGNYLPEVRKELKIREAKTDKSSIDEPLEVKLKDLPPHLEYAFLEGEDKLPVIITKDFSIEEETTLITILKSHKRAIAWKLFDIKIPINPKDQEKTTFTCPYGTFSYIHMPIWLCNAPGTFQRSCQKKGDAVKFLIPCDFLGMAECLALANLGASINLMPLSMWNNLSLYDLSPTCMTLELTDRSISHQVGVAEDVFVKVEAITFNLDQSSRYSANYNDMTTNRIDVIDMACEEYSQEVLSFSDVIVSGNPTPYYDPIASTTSPTLTPFGNSDFLLIEVDAYLALEDDPTSPKVDQSYVDSEGDILLLEAFLNYDPSLPAPNQGNYLPEVRKELKIREAKTNKSSIDEPLE
nr:reverse transcriptase domain-containing protein [Tanacetum cinerariifolium]